jgi:hypothetical protein
MRPAWRADAAAAFATATLCYIINPACLCLYAFADLRCAAPKPHRPVLEVRPWEKYEQQQEQKQNQEHQMQRRVEVEADGTRDGLEMRLEAKQQQQQQQAQLQNGKILHTLNGELLAHALEEQQHSEECLPHKQQRRPQQQPQPQLDGMEVG